MQLAAAGVVAIAGLLTGCGIAHKSVRVPELEIQLRGVSESREIDVTCPDFYAEDDSFVALITDTLSSTDYHYDWKRLRLAADPARLTCRKEDRYIGYAVIAFLPLGPSGETTKSRAILMRLRGEPEIFRIRFHGMSAQVEKTALVDSERQFPPELRSAEPAVNTAAWRERLQQRHKFYWETKWQPSNRIRVLHLESNEEGAITSALIEVTHDG